MNESLERLLDAEQRARRLVDDALAQRDRTLEKARHEAEEAERQFENRMQELRRGLVQPKVDGAFQFDGCFIILAGGLQVDCTAQVGLHSRAFGLSGSKRPRAPGEQT